MSELDYVGYMDYDAIPSFTIFNYIWKGRKDKPYLLAVYNVKIYG